MRKNTLTLPVSCELFGHKPSVTTEHEQVFGQLHPIMPIAIILNGLNRVDLPTGL